MYLSRKLNNPLGDISTCTRIKLDNTKYYRYNVVAQFFRHIYSAIIRVKLRIGNNRHIYKLIWRRHVEALAQLLDNIICPMMVVMDNNK